MLTEKDLPRLEANMKSAGITRVANVTGLDNIGIPVFVVSRPDSRSLSVSQGKGETQHAARISGIMESLEQFHAEHATLSLSLASVADLRTERAVVDTSMLPRTQRMFTEHTRILWATGKRLGTGEEVAVPWELVHLDLRTPLPEGSGYFPLGSNGLASGKTLLEAIAHGVWELIERDALALFYERDSREQADRRVRLDSVTDPSCRGLLRRFEAAEVGVAVWDMTSDVGIATFMVSIGERTVDPLRRVGTARGYGCHPNRAIALRRALTEAAQSRLTRITGSRDDIQPWELNEVRSEEVIQHQLAHVEQEQYASHVFASTPTHSFESTEEALGWTQEQLNSANLGDIVYVDLSREGWPIAVARSIIVGMEGFPDMPSYVAGRRVQELRKERN